MTNRDESIKVFMEFGQICNDFEFARAEYLSHEEKEKIGVEKGLVVIEKSINPGMNIEAVRGGDFISFLIDKMFENGATKEQFSNAFSGF